MTQIIVINLHKSEDHFLGFFSCGSNISLSYYINNHHESIDSLSKRNAGEKFADIVKEACHMLNENDVVELNLQCRFYGNHIIMHCLCGDKDDRNLVNNQTSNLTKQQAIDQLKTFLNDAKNQLKIKNATTNVQWRNTA